MPQDREIRYETAAADRRSMSEVVADLMKDFQAIFRAEVSLAAREVKAKARRGAKAVPPLSAAGLLGFFAAASFVTFCIVAMTIVIPLWLSALLMSVALGGAAGGAFLLGRVALEDVQPLPEQTLESVKDNIDWLRNRTS